MPLQLPCSTNANSPTSRRISSRLSRSRVLLWRRSASGSPASEPAPHLLLRVALPFYAPTHLHPPAHTRLLAPPEPARALPLRTLAKPPRLRRSPAAHACALLTPDARALRRPCAPRSCAAPPSRWLPRAAALLAALAVARPNARAQPLCLLRAWAARLDRTSPARPHRCGRRSGRARLSRAHPCPDRVPRTLLRLGPASSLRPRAAAARARRLRAAASRLPSRALDRAAPGALCRGPRAAAPCSARRCLLGRKNSSP
jgi:hypothetical protein